MLLNILFYFVLGLSLIFSLFLVRKNWSLAYKYLACYVVLVFYNEVYCLYLMNTTKVSTYIFYNMSFAMREPLLLAMFSCLVINRVLTKTVWSLVIVTLAMIPFLTAFYLNPFNNLFTHCFVILGVVVILSVLLYLHQLYTNEKVMNPIKQPLFLTSVGFFLYFLINIPFLGLYNSIVANEFFNIAQYQRFFAKSSSLFLYLAISIDLYKQWKKMSS